MKLRLPFTIYCERQPYFFFWESTKVLWFVMNQFGKRPGERFTFQRFESIIIQKTTAGAV